MSYHTHDSPTLQTEGVQEKLPFQVFSELLFCPCPHQKTFNDVTGPSSILFFLFFPNYFLFRLLTDEGRIPPDCVHETCWRRRRSGAAPAAKQNTREDCRLALRQKCAACSWSPIRIVKQAYSWALSDCLSQNLSISAWNLHVHKFSRRSGYTLKSGNHWCGPVIS